MVAEREVKREMLSEAGGGIAIPDVQRFDSNIITPVSPRLSRGVQHVKPPTRTASVHDDACLQLIDLTCTSAVSLPRLDKPVWSVSNRTEKGARLCCSAGHRLHERACAVAA